jgi:hypothetical protein
MYSADGNRIQPADLGILRPETTTSSWTFTLIHDSSPKEYIESRREVRRRPTARRIGKGAAAIDVRSAKVRAFLRLACVSVLEVCVSNGSHGQSIPVREGH